MDLPPVVSQDEWQAARDELLAKEKEATHALDALAAERRRLPRVLIEKPYVFEGPNGEASLLDLFEGRRQLLIYHFMFGPNQDVGCDGCSMAVDNFGHPAHLNARDTTLALVSRAPLEKIEPYRERIGISPKTPKPDYQDGESFGLSAFLRDGDSVYRTYFTRLRGVEAVGTNWTLLDLTPLGRQEDWEDSPEGYPQTPRYDWWRRHDEY